MNPEPRPGYVWLESPGKVLHAAEHDLEFVALDTPQHFDLVQSPEQPLPD